MGEVKFIPIHNWDNDIASTIKGKMNDVGGEIKLKNGNSVFEVAYADDESGITFTTIKGETTLLPWTAFFATVDILKEKDGETIKGDALKGKLGTKALPLDSVEGYVASTVFGKKKNQSVDKNITKISTLLKWTDVVEVGKDTLKLKQEYR